MSAVALCGLACASPPPAVAPAPPPPAAPTPPPPAPPPAREIAFGPLVVTLSTSRTAQVFHVVDALSAWSPSLRRSAYAAWAKKELALDAGDRAMLAEHAKLRRRRGWGALDEAFVVDDAIDDAAARAVEAKLLGKADAERERALLAHFAPKIAALLDAQQAALDAFVKSARDALPKSAPFAAKVGRWLDLEGPIDAPVFLCADPSVTQADASLHRGRLVVEVPPLAPGDDSPGIDASASLLHELFHAMLSHRRDSIAIGAGECKDRQLDEATLSEALAYAIAPGLVHAPDRDLLASMVDADRDRSPREPIVRFERLGLALRDPLRDAIESASGYHAFFPTACERWAALPKNQR